MTEPRHANEYDDRGASAVYAVLLEIGQVMKGYALAGRDKQKDAYDIYFSVREFAGGPDVLAQECAPLLNDAIALRGFLNIAEKFCAKDSYGPVTVRRFLSESTALGDMTEDQVQVDAYEQVRAWLIRLGL